MSYAKVKDGSGQNGGSEFNHLKPSHRLILDILKDGNIHHIDEFLDLMSYDGLRGRISELNKLGYIIRRVNETGDTDKNGKYFKLMAIPKREEKNLVLANLKPDKHGRVVIVPIGDIHYGNPEFTEKSEELLDGYLKYILENDGVYTILMGDLIESANERSTFSLKITPQEQYEWIHRKLKPLAENGKIIAILSGNHEQWIYRDKGFDVVKTLALALDVPYIGEAGYIGVRVGKQFYTIYAIHPKSGAVKKSSKIKLLEDLGSIHDVDIILCGHIHSIICEDQIKRRPNFVTGKIDNVKQLLVGTGMFLEYGGYAERGRYKPEKMGAPKIKLYAHKFDMHVGK